jgi:hypothetical protein
MIAADELYVVATIVRPVGNESDFFGDIILVTDNEKHARVTKHQVKARKPVPGLDYCCLVPFEDVIYFKRTLNQVVTYG